MVDKEKLSKYFTAKKKPVSFRDLGKEFCSSKKDYGILKKLLKQLASTGDIIVNRRGLYGKSEEMSLVTGYFEAHKTGYGFVILETPGQRDFFIPARKAMGAMDNDRVVARVENMKNREGRIIRIVERAHTKISGTLDFADDSWFLRPKHSTIPFDVLIPNKHILNAEKGDMVVVEITQFNNENRPPIGKVVKKIDKPEDPKSEIEAVIDEFHLSRKFPKHILDAAKTLPEAVTPEMFEGRRDLRGLNTVTIDGERAKDFDDAVSIEKTPAGFKLYVHIADVSYFVPWDSVIDTEARERATSVYFPDRVLPMLPRKLSEDLCSLKPKLDRLTFTAELDFDDKRHRTASAFYPSVINSNERMTYTNVQKIIIDEDKKLRAKYNSLLQEFELMSLLCKDLRQMRKKRGSLDFDLPEPEILLDMQGNLSNIIKTQRNFAHSIIEEFMIAANEAAAEYLTALGVPSLYRIHEEPDIRKMDDIMKVVNCTISYKKAKITPADFSKIIHKAAATPYEEVINYLILRSLKQARYSPINVGHFGLASTCYTHFTSPIRRYPDLVVHRILRDTLNCDKSGKPDKNTGEKAVAQRLSDVAFNSSRRERVAEEAEREVIDAMRTWFMKDRVGEVLDGKIAGMNSHGMKVRLNDYFVDGFLHISDMVDDYYVYEEGSLTIRGKNTNKTFSIGQAIQVRIDKVDIVEREIVFGL
ncbi:MAG: ribonuclease R [Nitrospirae bacterium]|nr:ribonuclease R [Nitrospirota bacterium]